MEKLFFDLSAKSGKFKVLNATNGGPWAKRHATDQLRSNFKAYKAARIPYSRNHDSGVNDIYGKSGPAKELIEYYSLNAKGIVEKAKQAISLKK